MAKLNENFFNLKKNYLFIDIGKRVKAYTAAHPEAKLIRMGIGDVTRPLCPAVVEAMRSAAAEMGCAETFRGYGPEQGYDFLRDRLRSYYEGFGVSLSEDEIFVSDGAKSDLGNILDIFSGDNSVLIPDPVYPVYVDTNVMDGRRIIYADADESNGFLPMPDGEKADIIYICSPNNPTGAAYSREQLKAWVDFALENGSVILFDSAYESFIVDPSVPHSIYEIPGAKGCAIEFCSLSKTAGFTGTRCGYTVVPDSLEFGGVRLNKLWLRRQTTKFNGVSYIVQRGAQAVFTPEGQAQTAANIAYYRENARVITAALDEMGIYYTGGKNSPYVWMKCPDGMDSWQFFDRLLERSAVVGTPGAGFGRNGEGFFRLTAFSTHENTLEATERLKNFR